MRQCLVVIAVLGLLCTGAQGAAILPGLLTPDGNPDTLNDNSRAMIFDNNNSNALDVGDDIVGLLQFEKVNASDPSPAGLFGIFAFRVSATRSLGGFIPVYDHAPIASADAHSLRSILDDGLEPGSFTNWDNAMFAFVEISSLGANDPKDPFSTTNSDPTDNPLSIINNVLSAANGYSLDALVGIGKSDDFLSTLPNVAIGFLIGNGDGAVTITEIRNDNSGNTVVSEKAGLSVLYDVVGASYSQLSITNYGAASSTVHDVILTPDGAVQTSTAAAPNWDLEDDSNFQINPVPEPGTMSLLISLVAALCFTTVSRRR